MEPTVEQRGQGGDAAASGQRCRWCKSYFRTKETHLQSCEVDDCIETRASHNSVHHSSISAVALQGKEHRTSW